MAKKDLRKNRSRMIQNVDLHILQAEKESFHQFDFIHLLCTLLKNIIFQFYLTYLYIFLNFNISIVFINLDICMYGDKP